MANATIDEAVTETDTKTKPVQKYNESGVSLSIFENKTKDGETFYKAVIQRNFKVGDEFRSNSSFSCRDLVVLQKIASQAQEWMAEKEAA